MKLAEQWAKVNTEHAGVAASQQEPTIFFTGKPYVDGLGYVFKYRNYNPELCRWQSADPSGFPDGANNQAYAPCPTSGLDPTGLYTVTQDISDIVANTMNSLIKGQLSVIGSTLNNSAEALKGQTLPGGGTVKGEEWKLSNFTICGSATGSTAGTTGWGIIGVNTPFSYSVPSGLMPDPSWGSDTTSGKVLTSVTINASISLTSPGFNYTFPTPVTYDTGTKFLGFEVYDTMKSLQLGTLNATLTASAIVVLYE